MSDDRERRLRREAAAGGPEAEAEWLSQQVRLGAISQPKLQLAAFLGYPAARLILERTRDQRAVLKSSHLLEQAQRGIASGNALVIPNIGPYFTWARSGFTRWVLELDKWGKEVCLRAASALQAWANPPESSRPTFALVRRALEGDEAARDEARARWEGEAPMLPVSSDPSWAQVDQALLRALVLDDGDERIEDDNNPTSRIPSHSAALSLLVERCLASGSQGQEIPGHLRRGLVPWLLGYEA